MVNKFGDRKSGDQGPAGPPGKKGKDGVNYARWLPKKTLGWFRETEECSIYFDNKTDGFVTKTEQGVTKVVGLKNHSKENDVMCVTVGGWRLGESSCRRLRFRI